jgi:hypothetical protein
VDSILNRGVSGSGEWIGIISPTLHDWNDLTNFAAYWGLSGYGLYYWPIDGGATDFGGQLEACLDGDVIMGQARSSNIVFFQSPNTGASLLNMYNTVCAANYSVLSNSWLWNETDLRVNFNAYLQSLEVACSQMAAQGIAHYNASGDWTAKPNGSDFAVHYPASSPNVTGVGGTDFLSDSGGYWASEQGWNAAGGGYSSQFNRPFWQTGNGVDTGVFRRQVPDISALSGINPGYWVMSNSGSWYQVYGTSAAAPLWSAVHLMLDDANGTRWGNLNQWYYWIGRNLNTMGNFVFHDMVAGDNGYPTTAGYDKVSGWGSADFGKLYADRFLKPNLAAYNPGGGFKDAIMIYSVAGNLVEPNTFHEGFTYYLISSQANYEYADSVACWVQYLKNGGHVGWMFYGPWPNSWFLYYYDGPTTTFSAGYNTVTTFVDGYNNMVSETNEMDNIYNRKIKVYPQLVSATCPSTRKGGLNLPVTLNFSSNLLSGKSITISSNNQNAIPNKTFTKVGVSSFIAGMATKTTPVNKVVTLVVKYGEMKQTLTVTLTP